LESSPASPEYISWSNCGTRYSMQSKIMSIVFFSVPLK
jgi:hypothetical protein